MAVALQERPRHHSSSEQGGRSELSGHDMAAFEGQFDSDTIAAMEGQFEPSAPERAGVPTGTQTIAELERQSRNPLLQELELKHNLHLNRRHLAELAAKRSSRLRTFKRGNLQKEYEITNAGYQQNLQDYLHLKHPELHIMGNESPEEYQEKATQATGVLLKEMEVLRSMTSRALESTPVGRIARWMNEGGRLRQFVKYAGIGLAAGAAGAIVAGSMGVGIAAGLSVSAGSRFVRGVLRAEDGDARRMGVRHDRVKARWGLKRDVIAVDKQGDTDFIMGSLARAGGRTSLIDAGTMSLAARFAGDIETQQKLRQRSAFRGLTRVALGGAFGEVYHVAEHALGLGMATANAEPQPTTQPNMQDTSPDAGHFKMADQQSMVDYHNEFEVYHWEKDPFFAADKSGIHDMGDALKPGGTLDGQYPAGWNDLTQVRWANSPHQFASAAAAMHLNGMPDDMQTINNLAAHYESNHDDWIKDRQTVLGMIHPDGVKGGVPITHAYASEYGVDMGNHNVQLAWDDSVNEGGTKTVIDYVDQNGVHRTLELRDQCGGQRICEYPDQPVVASAPQGGGHYVPDQSAPQGGGHITPQNTQPDRSTPDQSQPQGGGHVPPPVEQQPADTTPVPSQPANNVPTPVGNTPKGNEYDTSKWLTNMLGLDKSESQPANVQTQQTITPSRDVGVAQNPIPDNIKVTPGNQTGGNLNNGVGSLNTSGNSGTKTGIDTTVQPTHNGGKVKSTL